MTVQFIDRSVGISFVAKHYVITNLSLSRLTIHVEGCSSLAAPTVRTRWAGKGCPSGKTTVTHTWRDGRGREQNGPLV